MPLALERKYYSKISNSLAWLQLAELITRNINIAPKGRRGDALIVSVSSSWDLRHCDTAFQRIQLLMNTYVRTKPLHLRSHTVHQKKKHTVKAISINKIKLFKHCLEKFSRNVDHGVMIPPECQDHDGEFLRPNTTAQLGDRSMTPVYHRLALET